MYKRQVLLCAALVVGIVSRLAAVPMPIDPAIPDDTPNTKDPVVNISDPEVKVDSRTDGKQHDPGRDADSSGTCLLYTSFASQLPLLDGPEWDMDKQYKVASNVKPYQAADHIGKVLGDTAFVLPYSQELEEQYLAGNLLADLTLKDSRPFRKELERIIAEVF